MKRNKKHDLNKLQESSILGAAIATSAVSGAVTVIVAEHQSREVDKKYYSHWLSDQERNKPLNERQWIQGHNTGTEYGSGTILIAQNQNLSVSELLEETPTRSFEIKIHAHEGEFIINHGGIIDPLVSDPLSLSDYNAQVDS